MWQSMRLNKITDHGIEHWSNDLYNVLVTTHDGTDLTDFHNILHLEVASLSDGKPSQEHKQHIKNEIVGTEEEAIELYPAQSRLEQLVYRCHLWCVYGFKFPFEIVTMIEKEIKENTPIIIPEIEIVEAFDLVKFGMLPDNLVLRAKILRTIRRSDIYKFEFGDYSD